MALKDYLTDSSESVESDSKSALRNKLTDSRAYYVTVLCMVAADGFGHFTNLIDGISYAASPFPVYYGTPSYEKYWTLYFACATLLMCVGLYLQNRQS